MRSFEYARPSSVDEAITLLGHDEIGESRPLAGGTDLLTLMKAGIVAPSRLLDIKRADGLAGGIEQTDQGLTLGALTTLAEIETNAMIKDRYPVLAEAAALAATAQLRNMATIGGNLLQRPRCWYFRNAHLNCWLKGGDHCPAYDGENQLHALFGDGPCYAVHPSDLASALLTLDAEVQVQGKNGEHTVPLADFFALPTDDHRTETTLGVDELVLSIRIPPLPDGTQSIYLKAMDRKVWAFALVGVAAALRREHNRITHARLTLSGVAPIPWRVRDAEQELIGAEVSDETFARAAGTALATAQPLRLNGYKVPLARALIRRALSTLAA
jgi:xanthine dehydrogenase YagS FAD-binding subunit